MAKVQPWERIDGESDSEWEGFVLYRDAAYPQGIAPGAPYVPRRQAAICELLEVSRGTLGTLMSRRLWHLRALHYDRHVDSLRQDVRESELRKVTREHTRSLSSLRTLIEGEVAKHKARAEEDPTVAVTSLKESVEMLERVIKLDRLVLGASTDNVHQERTDRTEAWNRAERWNLEALSLEELEHLEGLRTRARGPEPVPTTVDEKPETE